jgi:hypothetical protein
MEKLKMIPSVRLPILLREKQTKVFGCIEIKSVLVYKYLLKKYDFDAYIKTDTQNPHIIFFVYVCLCVCVCVWCSWDNINGETL